MTDKETFQCYWCKKELTVNDIVISSSKWAFVKNVVNLCWTQLFNQKNTF